MTLACDEEPSAPKPSSTVVEATASPLVPNPRPAATAAGGEPAAPAVTEGAGDSSLKAENEALRKQMLEMQEMMAKLMAAQNK